MESKKTEIQSIEKMLASFSDVKKEAAADFRKRRNPSKNIFSKAKAPD